MSSFSHCLAAHPSGHCEERKTEEPTMPAQKTEEEIAIWKQVERIDALKQFTPDPSYPDIDLQKFEEDYLTPHLDFRADRYRASTQIQVATSLFQFLTAGTDLSQQPYRYKVMLQQTEGLPLNSEKAKHTQDSLFYGLVYDQLVQAKEDIGNTHFAIHPSYAVRLYPNPQAAGFFNYSLFGRSVDIIPPDAQWIGKEHIDAAECYILEYTHADAYVKLWIDVDKDFSIRQFEYSESRDTIVRQRGVYKHFEKFSDVWYPKVRDSTIYNAEGTMRNNIRIDILNAQFNVIFPEGFFEIDQEFYYQHQNHRRRIERSLDSGPAPPDRTEPEERLLLCGPQSLLKICERLNVQTHISELKKLSGFHPNRGTTMLGLKRAAAFKNLAPIGVKATLPLLKKKKVPLFLMKSKPSAPSKSRHPLHGQRHPNTILERPSAGVKSDTRSPSKTSVKSR